MKNIKIMIKLFLCFLFLVEGINFSFAEKVSDLKIDKYVNDYANIIDDNQEGILEKDLYDFFASTTHQIVIVTVNDIDSDYIEHYSIKLAEKIKAGNAKNDNGILVLVSKNDRQMRIEVGYGLEEVMTDGKSSYIIKNIMTPNFKNGDYTKGITEGLKEIQKISSDKNYNPEDGTYSFSFDTSKSVFASNILIIIITSLFPVLFFIFFLSIQWFISVLGRTKSWWLGGVVGLIISLIVFFLFIKVIWIFILSVLGFVFDYFVSKNYKEHKEGIKDGPADWWSGGSWGPGSSGGWGGGYSSSGGGFSGGGGGFGGGGSSGSW